MIGSVVKSMSCSYIAWLSITKVFPSYPQFPPDLLVKPGVWNSGCSCLVYTVIPENTQIRRE